MNNVTDATPTTQDLHGDTAGGGLGLPDELTTDQSAFLEWATADDAQPTEDELEAEFARLYPPAA